jgi:hypothetical protein
METATENENELRLKKKIAAYAAVPQLAQADRVGLLASAPESAAVEQLVWQVWQVCHVTLLPLRLLSGYVSRQRRAPC